MNSGIFAYCIFTLIYSISSRPQLGYPVPHRPSYSPNPSGSHIAQIVPPGKPWPSKPGDYNSFSQTTRRSATPAWATTMSSTAAPTPTIDDRLPDFQTSSHKHWSRPTIVFHEPFLRGKNATTNSHSLENTTIKRMEISNTSSEVPIVPINLPEIGLFTSAPTKEQPKSFTMEAITVGVANLLPEDVSITF